VVHSQNQQLSHPTNCSTSTGRLGLNGIFSTM